MWPSCRGNAGVVRRIIEESYQRLLKHQLQTPGNSACASSFISTNYIRYFHDPSRLATTLTRENNEDARHSRPNSEQYGYNGRVAKLQRL